MYLVDWKEYIVYDLYGSYWVSDELILCLVMENVIDCVYLVLLGDVLVFIFGCGWIL